MLKAIAAAQAAIDTHSQRYCLEPSDADVQVWHLVASLMEWCDDAQINFDEIVSQCRDEYGSTYGRKS